MDAAFMSFERDGWDIRAFMNGALHAGLSRKQLSVRM
jgi:hypothetical protein